MADSGSLSKLGKSSTALFSGLAGVAGFAAHKFLGWSPEEATTLLGVLLAPFGFKEGMGKIGGIITMLKVQEHLLKMQEQPGATAPPLAAPVPAGWGQLPPGTASPGTPGAAPGIVPNASGGVSPTMAMMTGGTEDPPPPPAPLNQ